MWAHPRPGQHHPALPSLCGQVPGQHHPALPSLRPPVGFRRDDNGKELGLHDGPPQQSTTQQRVPCPSALLSAVRSDVCRWGRLSHRLLLSCIIMVRPTDAPWPWDCHRQGSMRPSLPLGVCQPRPGDTIALQLGGASLQHARTARFMSLHQLRMQHVVFARPSNEAS